MTTNAYRNLILIALALIFGFTACAGGGGRRANLKRIKYDKENDLRRDWINFTTYKRYRPADSFQRGATAFLYKLKDDKKILMDKQWIAVTSEDVKAKTKIWEATISAEVRGQNEDLYGYLVYRQGDLPNVKIIDAQTVQLFYHYSQNYSR